MSKARKYKSCGSIHVLSKLHVQYANINQGRALCLVLTFYCILVKKINRSVDLLPEFVDIRKRNNALRLMWCLPMLFLLSSKLFFPSSMCQDYHSGSLYRNFHMFIVVLPA